MFSRLSCGRACRRNSWTSGCAFLFLFVSDLPPQSSCVWMCVCVCSYCCPSGMLSPSVLPGRLSFENVCRVVDRRVYFYNFFSNNDRPPYKIVTPSSAASPNNNTNKERFVSQSRHLRHHFHNSDIILRIRFAYDSEERQRRIDELYFFRVETEELDLHPPC
jgi:hypothetical protein